jgi:hypothetical protein
MLRFSLVVFSATLGACTSTPKNVDEVVANSLGDVDERPLWTIDGRFQEFQGELEDKERKSNLYRVGFYSTQKRTDLDLCYQFARTKVETEIRQSIGQALSTVIEEAVDAGNITEGEASRMQNVTTVSAAKGALAGLEVSERFWQQVNRAGDQGAIYECFVLAKMPMDVYKKQLQRSIARMDGVSEEIKAKLEKRSDEADEIIRNQLQ